MKQLFYTVVLLLIMTIHVGGQDPQFTQFYANSLYLAPSFAGATEQHRLAGSFRDQWPGYPGSFISYTFSYDRFFSNYNSGVGIMVMRDQAGAGRLNNTSASLHYSYVINIPRGWHIRPGISFTYAMWGLDFHKLIFSDQLYTGLGDANTATTVETPPTKGFVGDVDAGLSLLLYQERFWMGAAVDHLLKPNQAFYNVKSIVPKKYSFFGGYQLVKYQRLLKPIDETISLAYLYRSQQIINSTKVYKQLDLGLYWYHYPLILGFWYRGIPLVNSPRGDALAFLVGLKADGLNIGYSYDFTVSNLIRSSRGAHEITLIYQFKTKPVKKMHSIPCPEF